MNNEETFKQIAIRINAIEISLNALAGFVAAQSPQGQLGQFLQRIAEDFTKPGGADAAATVALLRQMIDSANRGSIIKRQP